VSFSSNSIGVPNSEMSRFFPIFFERDQTCYNFSISDNFTPGAEKWIGCEKIFQERGSTMQGGIVFSE